MTSLTQYMGGGSIPEASTMTLFPPTTPPLVQQDGDYYVRTGSVVYGITPKEIETISRSNNDFLVPSLASQVANDALRDFDKLVYGNGVYVKASSRALLRSTDGVTWKPVLLNTFSAGADYQGAQIVFGNGMFVVLIGQSNATNRVFAAYSTDALNWTHVVVGAKIEETTTGSNNLQSGAVLSFANDAFFIWGRLGTTNRYEVIIRSTDGIVWDLLQPIGYPVARSNGFSVVYGGGVYLATGPYPDALSAALYRSTDGITWTSIASPAQVARGLWSLKYLNGVWCALTAETTTNTQLYTSIDGSTWTARTTGAAGVTFYDIAYLGGVYVIGGTTGALYTSPDLATWTSQTFGVAATIRTLDVYNARFIAIHAAGMRYSTDGVTWTATTGSSVARGETANVCSTPLAVLNSVYHAISTNGGIYKSADGMAWEPVLALEALNTSGLMTISKRTTSTNSVHKAGNYIFACTSAGGIIRIDSSNNLLQVNTLTTVFNAVTYGEGVYVAVGNGGAIYTSTDSLTWTSRTSGTASNLVAVAHNGTTFVTISSTYTAYSADGITWTSASLSGPSQLCVVDNQFFAFNGTTTAYRSLDGVTWVSRVLGFSQTIMRPFSKGVYLCGNATASHVLYTNGSLTYDKISTVTEIGEINGQLYLSTGPNYSITSANTVIPAPLPAVAVGLALTTEFATQGKSLGGAAYTVNGMFKIGNSTLIAATNGYAMYNLTNWVPGWASAPNALETVLNNARDLIDGKTTCWAVTSGGYLTLVYKYGVSSLSLSVTPMSTYGNSWTQDGSTASTVYNTLVAYRKIT